MNKLALHKLSYGIYVLSTKVGDAPFGCIINTVFQITSEPAQITISCNKDNFTHDKIKEAGVFAISALAEDASPDLIATFGYKSGKDVDKFEKHPFQVGTELSLPIFQNDSVASFECRVVNELSVGTHTIFIGSVEECSVIKDDVKEMTYRYYHEIRKGLAPKNAPTYIEETPKEPKQRCSICGYIYDEDTPFEELDDNWVCPICGAKKELFTKI